MRLYRAELYENSHWDEESKTYTRSGRITRGFTNLIPATSGHSEDQFVRVVFVGEDGFAQEVDPENLRIVDPAVTAEGEDAEAGPILDFLRKIKQENELRLRRFPASLIDAGNHHAKFHAVLDFLIERAGGEGVY